MSICKWFFRKVTFLLYHLYKYNSYKGNVGKVAPNRINRRFHTSIPHQKITTDTTEFKYYEVDEKGRMIMKKLYLDPFMDMCNGEIVSYSISKQPSAVGIMEALKEAIEKYIIYYNNQRIKQKLGWMSPVEYRLNILAA